MSYEYYFEAFRKYAEFTGRARRSEFWFFILFQFIITFLLLVFGLTMGSSFGIILVSGLWLGSIIPYLALIVRRLHDVGKSGWFYFITLIPILGPIWLIILYCTDSDYGPNQYGLNPKGLGNEDNGQSDELIKQIGQEE